MKPFLRLIKGGKPPKMRFGSFGRARDIEMLEQSVTDPKMKALWIAQTSAAHDLNDGIGDVQAFIEATRKAVYAAAPAAREPALVMLARISNYYPGCLVVWEELAASSSWQDRFTVACHLYWHIPAETSNRLFNVLRHDKSKRVREMAVSRYEDRPDERGHIILGKFDASQFDERVRRGEVKL